MTSPDSPDASARGTGGAAGSSSSAGRPAGRTTGGRAGGRPPPAVTDAWTRIDHESFAWKAIDFGKAHFPHQMANAETHQDSYARVDPKLRSDRPLDVSLVFEIARREEAPVAAAVAVAVAVSVAVSIAIAVAVTVDCGREKVARHDLRLSHLDRDRDRDRDRDSHFGAPPNHEISWRPIAGETTR